VQKNHNAKAWFLRCGVTSQESETRLHSVRCCKKPEKYKNAVSKLFTRFVGLSERNSGIGKLDGETRIRVTSSDEVQRVASSDEVQRERSFFERGCAKGHRMVAPLSVNVLLAQMNPNVGAR
jgi:hypothetical protein